ncbi:unnamed protein product [Cuscuta europaea]|uniref:Membrane-associated kinase regulator 1 n=1 Tax=Cuscuta europaea TaxID=41803 RepID=A0A9P0ZHU2_CUSEU|nr:unnamed protein product [Cuscuta europaea]
MISPSAMGRRKDEMDAESETAPSPSIHSSSSSEFEFAVAITPGGAGPSSTSSSASTLCPADELFYKGQLLPLHLSPRRSMLRTLLLASSSTSSSDSLTTASRDSTGSSNDSRPSFSVADLLLPSYRDCSRSSSAADDADVTALPHHSAARKTHKYLNFSLSRFSCGFRKARVPDSAHAPGSVPAGPSSVKRMSKTAREVVVKYLKKAKPLYEKLSQNTKLPPPPPQRRTKTSDEFLKGSDRKKPAPRSFSGNLSYSRMRRRRSDVSSCPSSMRSSPSHSGMICRVMVSPQVMCKAACLSEISSIEELQTAVQGAIAHCKNSMIRNSSTAMEP